MGGDGILTYHSVGGGGGGVLKDRGGGVFLMVGVHIGDEKLNVVCGFLL